MKKLKKYYWSGISNDERIKAVNEITSIVNRHAIILNFQKFSDISLGLLLEIEEFELFDLQNKLKKIMHLEGSLPELTDSNTDCILHFNITFSKGTGDLKIEVPSFPG